MYIYSACNRISHLLNISSMRCIITPALWMTESRSPMSIKNFFQFAANELIKGTKINFRDFKGKVVLVENVASLWGTTVRDYTQMNELVNKFGDNLVILGFPCNQFGHQVCYYLEYNWGYMYIYFVRTCICLIDIFF